MEKTRNVLTKTGGRSLRRRIMLSMALVVVIVALALGISSSIVSYSEASENIDNLLETTGNICVEALDDYLDALIYDVATLAKSGAVTSTDLTFEQRQQNINRVYALRESVVSLYTVDSSGIAVNDAAVEDVGEDYSEEPFFIVGMENEGGYVDVPYFDEWNDSITMTVSYKLNHQDGFSGLVCKDVSYETVQNMTTVNALGETGYNFLVDQDGIIRSHPNESLVVDEIGAVAYFGEDSAAAVALSEILAAESGTSREVRLDGEMIRMYSDTIDATGWKFVTLIKTDEFMGGFRNQLLFIIGGVIVCMIIALIIASLLSGRIAAPISAMRKRMELLAAGDLHSPLPKNDSADEIGVLYASMETSLRSLSHYSADISNTLKRLSEGDLSDDADEFSIDVNAYVGDYAPMKESLDSLKSSLQRFFSGTGNASKLIAATSVQMAAASQELSSNTIEQAQSIDRIDRRFIEIKDSLEAMVKESSDTLEKTVTTCNELVRSREDMKLMLEAMREIESASQSIVKINKEIDDIAFLSNILSLNAAIEAARAGVHGKGFGVVADEVRDLAGKSAQSAQYTEELITGAIGAVDKGMDIANDTSEKIEVAYELLVDVSSLIKNIEETVAKHAAVARDIYTDLSNLNRLVQNDTAMAQQSASASSELSERMRLLDSELSFFRTDD